MNNKRVSYLETVQTHRSGRGQDILVLWASSTSPLIHEVQGHSLDHGQWPDCQNPISSAVKLRQWNTWYTETQKALPFNGRTDTWGCLSHSKVKVNAALQQRAPPKANPAEENVSCMTTTIRAMSQLCKSSAKSLVWCAYVTLDGIDRDVSTCAHFLTQIGNLWGWKVLACQYRRRYIGVGLFSHPLDVEIVCADRRTLWNARTGLTQRFCLPTHAPPTHDCTQATLRVASYGTKISIIIISFKFHVLTDLRNHNWCRSTVSLSE